jgi:hypothetical protein
MSAILRVFHNGIQCPAKEIIEHEENDGWYIDVEVEVPVESFAVDFDKTQDLDEDDLK